MFSCPIELRSHGTLRSNYRTFRMHTKKMASRPCYRRVDEVKEACEINERQSRLLTVNDRVNQLANDEFARLKGVAYMDHAGTTLYAESQLKSVFEEMSANIYGNPHSRNASSKLSTDVIDHVRIRVAQHFNTTLDEYSVIFTSGASGACKLMAEAFDWRSIDETGSGGHFMYLEDNHTSVLGIRALASELGATTSCIRLDEAAKYLEGRCPSTMSLAIRPPTSKNCLFVYPAQSNFCGRKYPPFWIEKIQRGALRDFLPPHCSQQDKKSIRWSVGLDAAAYVGTSALDLCRWKPDFVFLSFHKMFGFPTGLGALLVHRTASDLLPGRYFGGGNVLVSLVHEDFHLFRKSLQERFEAGTVSYLDILAVRHGLDFLQKISGLMGSNGNVMESITSHTFRLARRLHHCLDAGRHGSGSKMAVVYCATDFDDPSTQGAIVNFNLLRSDGHHVGFTEVEKMAAVYDIHFRTGCMCNPGSCQRYLRLSVEQLKQHLNAGHVCGDEMDLIDGRPTGSIRVSFGYMSSDEDVDRLLRMIDVCFVVDATIRELDTAMRSLRVEAVDSVDNYLKMPTPSPLVDDTKIWTQVMAAKSIKGNAPSRGCNCSSFGYAKCIGTHVTNVFLYPVKSCGSSEISSWPVTSRGLLFDRQWMVVINGGVVLTQKREPKMCLIRPEVDVQRGRLWLHHNDISSVSVSLADGVEKEVSAVICQSKVCGDRVTSIDCGNEVAHWLSTVLGRTGCRLVRQPPDSIRERRKGKNDSLKAIELSLANEAQYLMLNRSSVAVVHRSLTTASASNDPHFLDVVYRVAHEELSIDKLLDRFRGNLIVDGAKPFIEDRWTRLTIGRQRYIVQGPCSRCQMVCIDQDTGARSTEPLLTLSAVRERKMTFGIYLCRDEDSVMENEKIISVGDPVNATM